MTQKTQSIKEKKLKNGTSSKLKIVALQKALLRMQRQGKEWKKYVQIAQLTKDEYPGYVQNSQTQHEKENPV